MVFEVKMRLGETEVDQLIQLPLISLNPGQRIPRLHYIMASLNITLDDIPNLKGKRVIITGASSGIGLGAAHIFAKKGAYVLNLDLNPPPGEQPQGVEFRQCDISKWASLVDAFQHAGTVDIAVSNAGISEETDYFADTFDETTGDLLEPKYAVMNVNLRAVANFTKLAISHFRRRGCPGSIVITSSATAYSPEQSLPIYSACKVAVRNILQEQPHHSHS